MSLIKSITTVGGWTMISRVTGFLRDIATADILGASAVADAFFVALRLPNLFRRLFAEGAFSAAFVPIFSGHLAVNDKEEARKFAEKSLCFLTFILLIFVVLIEILMPYLMPYFAPGFDKIAGKLELTTKLCRITFPYLLFISLVSFQSGVLNSLGKFAAPAAAPIFFNVTGILALYLLSPWTETPAHALSIGVALSGIIQMLWLSFNIKREGFKIKIYPSFFLKGIPEDIKNLFKKILPGVFGAGIYQINLVVDTILVSLVADGAVSWLHYSNHLIQLPLGVVGIAVGTALLPMLSKAIKSGNHDEALKLQNKSLEISLLLTVPASCAFIVLAKPIVATLFEHGAFGQAETIATANAVIAFSLGIPAYVIAKVFGPSFFAQGDTVTPVKISVICLFANIILNVALMFPFGHVGIAMATTISAWLGAFIMGIKLKKKNYFNIDKKRKTRIMKIVLASGIMTAYLVLVQYGLNLWNHNWLDTVGFIRLGLFFGLILTGLLVFVFAALMVKATDIAEFKRAFKRG
ncbi:MAG: murein biosynthesis integral membrane protein MurJ [Alphaproteobacteria bacterium]